MEWESSEGVEGGGVGAKGGGGRMWSRNQREGGKEVG